MDWRSIGLQLQLKTSVLDQVEADYHTQSERFRVTLEKWLQLNVAVTWAYLELAITNANRESLGLQPLMISKRYIIVLTSPLLAICIICVQAIYLTVFSNSKNFVIMIASCSENIPIVNTIQIAST